jgi:NAD(P)-dependent dehydrogenase (short-subunit alcohol dehydrogenase family)
MIAEIFRLDGHVAIVTGASRGLGREMAQALAEAGASVALLARGRDAVERAAAEIAEDTGRPTLGLKTDVRDESEVGAAMERIVETLGLPDILVNNAGIVHQALLRETESDDWDRVLDINVGGLLTCTRAFLRRVADEGGSIVNVASLGAAAGVVGQVPYCASKGAVVSATRALAVETARQQVRVNAISPGYFATDMPAEVINDADAYERLLRRIPSRRLGRAEEIGPLVVYLASDAASYVTGATIAIDGGYTAI